MTNAPAPDDLSVAPSPNRSAARLHRALGTLFALAALAACGGGSAQRPPEALWSVPEHRQADLAVLDIVPAHVGYAYMVDLTPEDAAMLRAQWLGSPLLRSVADELRRETGIDLTGDDALERLGVDLEGEFAVFSTALSPVAVFELADADAFRALVDGQRERNPDIVWSTTSIAGVEFDSGTDGEVALDVAVVGDYGVLRFRAGDDGLDVSDDELAAVLLGSDAGSLRVDPRVLALETRGTGHVTGLSLVDTATLWNAVAAFAGSELGDYTDDAQRAACQAAADATLQAVPWTGMIRRRHDETPGLQQAWYVTRLGQRAAERAATLLTGTVTQSLAVADQATVYMAGNIDFDGLLGAMNADPELRHCPDLGALPGYLASFRQRYDRALSGAARQFTGLGALALYRADISGLIPRVDLVVMVGSTDPVDVVERIQALIESYGGTGRVDTTAPYTTLEYAILGSRVRLLQLQDRVVIATGDVPVDMTNLLASSTSGRAGAPFHTLRIDGPRLADMVRQVYQRVVDMGAVSPDQAAAMEAGLSSYDAMRWMTVSAWVEGTDLVMQVDAELDLTQAR